ncbi:MFS transporter [Microbacterium sorbitolivorans]|uniref:MFS transporter n=1 Tax=Microbacterium sorbitolivorans TaxID=1867410 RepID=A0A367Y6V9_9MICO|nr:MFS transporter [Microbacterium sorbitolivorans]RCK61605.1 MFS transporter [Microbacterium sorbitolivorans]GGF30775.1 MFS transporter [Microbacterium sorbitolivorans]
MTSLDQHASSSAAARLDRARFGRPHLKILSGSGVGWALDAMDVGLISFIIAALGAEWQLDSATTGWIASVGFIGMAIGASVGGLLADKLGRRQVFAITLLIYGVATGASALVGGVGALLVLRFLVGLGLGSELPVASTYVSEFAPAKIRGRLVVVLEAFWAVGWTAAALIGYFVVPLENGWRWAFAIGAVPAVYALVVRWTLPESPRWLESKGRFAEAQTIVDRFEHGSVAAAPTASAAVPRAGFADLFRGGLAPRTLALWSVWAFVNFSYYGAFIWIPSILHAQGFDLVRSFGYTLIITLAQLPGYALAAWLIEVWGRRATLSVFLVGSAISAMLFGTAGEVWQILLFGCLLSFFNLGAWGALYAVSPEVYPTAVRATGAGAAAAVGRIASIVAPLFTPWALGVGGAPLVFTVFAICFAIAAASAWGLSELKGRSLA